MNTKKSKGSGFLKSTLIFGFSWFFIGYFGSLLINPNASLGPLLGIFVTGPIGFVLGGIVSFKANKIKHKNESRNLNELNPFPTIWNRIIWTSAGLAVIVIVSAYIYIPAYENKNSIIIREAADLDKRDKTLTNLRVRVLSDFDLIKLESFKQLEHLDFCAGSGVGNAKITDEGLKILSEMKLPKLKSLNFCRCENITDNGIEHLKKIPTLRQVFISECINVSDSARDELIKKINLY
jgi:hypothetical protein